MKKIRTKVIRGRRTGVELTPHWYVDGHFLVSKGGNTTDCAIKVYHEHELEGWMQRGYSIRMSGPGVAPSLYTPKSLSVEVH